MDYADYYDDEKSYDTVVYSRVSMARVSNYDRKRLLTHVAARDWEVWWEEEEDSCHDHVQDTELYTESMQVHTVSTSCDILDYKSSQAVQATQKAFEATSSGPEDS